MRAKARRHDRSNDRGAFIGAQSKLVYERGELATETYTVVKVVEVKDEEAKTRSILKERVVIKNKK